MPSPFLALRETSWISQAPQWSRCSRCCKFW